eukprot:TRINITY_DN68029_c0_g1_i1.p1 TRINITY_DN68029_c0_g1~~TRINITY_DN68029_c0_g1_i1.p1  ORF type:complete len:550 (-),score=108.02 TRINITY_DN68029_c0_g1_i1:85-1734(-)
MSRRRRATARRRSSSSRSRDSSGKSSSSARSESSQSPSSSSSDDEQAAVARRAAAAALAIAPAIGDSLPTSRKTEESRKDKSKSRNGKDGKKAAKEAKQKKKNEKKKKKKRVPTDISEAHDSKAKSRRRRKRKSSEEEFISKAKRKRSPSSYKGRSKILRDDSPSWDRAAKKAKHDADEDPSGEEGAESVHHGDDRSLSSGRFAQNVPISGQDSPGGSQLDDVDLPTKFLAQPACMDSDDDQEDGNGDSGVADPEVLVPPSPPKDADASDVETEKTAKQRELDNRVKKALEESRERLRNMKTAVEPEVATVGGAGSGGDVRSSSVTIVPQLTRVKAPCDLPVWCVSPNPDDVVRDVEICRLTSSKGRTISKRIRFGRRPWVLLGRRDGQALGPEPDIGLGATRASRKHAVLLRNWKGQIFLMDLGSSHGSYLGKTKLLPHTAVEWKVNRMAYFGDRAVELFQLLPAESPSRDAASAAPVVLPSQDTKGNPQVNVVSKPPPRSEPPLRPLSPKKDTTAEPLYPGEWHVPADGMSKFYRVGSGSAPLSKVT